MTAAGRASGGRVSAGRVIAGAARSIRLEAPGTGTRPMADRVKQTLFAILEPDLPGARVLDLFAGSGAAGIEALSRGAAAAAFVERDPRAASIIAANLRRTGLAHLARVIRADVGAYLRDPTRAADEPWDLVILDPPYDQPGDLLAALQVVGPRVGTGGWVVVKHFWRDAPPAGVGLLASARERRFGETVLTFYRRTDDAVEDG
ncbi:MAG: RsmD family RNA methyltransferase [Chloroflexi bacterium]|nr:RsmD family RNA methyltransferase [Chloroflexota bacterium]